jgi:hypothetical protein
MRNGPPFKRYELVAWFTRTVSPQEVGIMTRDDLEPLVLEALKALGGAASPAGVCREVWARHEAELRDAGDLFFTWQYDIRWAALKLRKRGVLVPAERRSGALWRLATATL